jgi:hypothetical protein
LTFGPKPDNVFLTFEPKPGNVFLTLTHTYIQTFIFFHMTLPTVEGMINKHGKKGTIENLSIHSKSIQYGPIQQTSQLQLETFFNLDKIKSM